MKKAINTLLAITLIVTSLVIVGCLPPNFTKEKAQKIAKEHYPEAVAWFKEHKPEAKVDSDYEAYNTGIDLLGAVKGEYKANGKSYKYVYDYKAKKMYVGEGYEQACKLVEDAILKEIGYAKENTEVTFHGYTFTASNENDDLRGRYADEDKKVLNSYQEKLLPADMSPQAFAAEALKSKSNVNFPFYVTTYNEQFPEYKPQILQDHNNLGSIWCSVPIDCEKGFNGVCRKLYKADKVSADYCHVEKIYDGLYGGYVTRNGAVQDKLIITRRDSKSFRMEIPENARPVFFSKSSVKLLHSFKNSAGKVIKNEQNEMYKSSCPGNKSCSVFDVGLMTRNNVAYGYSSIYISYVKGVYDYKVLGVFDLEYWEQLFS